MVKRCVVTHPKHESDGKGKFWPFAQAQWRRFSERTRSRMSSVVTLTWAEEAKPRNWRERARPGLLANSPFKLSEPAANGNCLKFQENCLRMQEEKIDSRQLESVESLNVSRFSASLPVQPEKILTKRKAEPTRRILELPPMVGAPRAEFHSETCLSRHP